MHAIRRLLPVSLIALSSAFGQAPTDPQPLPPGVPAGVPTPAPAPTVRPIVPPVPGAAVPNPAAANQANQANQANVPLAERKITEPIVEPKLTGNDLAGKYRAFTGRRVVVSAAAAAAEFSFVQDASPTDPLTYAEAAKLLKMAALIEGFVFVPAEEGVDKLMFSAASSGPKQEGIEVYNDNDTLPNEDRVVTYVMGLKYLKPDEAVRVFTTIIGQFGSYGSIAAIANTSAVIITEKTSLIRKLLELKGEIDKPGTEVATRFIKVQYADPTELAQTLNELLNTQAQGQRTAGVQRTESNPSPNPAGGANAALAAANAAAHGGEENPPQIVPDSRTNRIFAMGRPIDLVFIEGLVREFDTQSEQKNFLRRKLRYIAVASFLDTAENALNRAFTSGTAGSSGGSTGGGAGSTGANFGGGNRSGTTGTTSNNRSGSTGSRGGSSSSSSGGSSSFGSSGGSGGSGGGGSGADALSDPNTNTAPESRLVGRTLLVADNVTNSLVVQGTPASIEVVEKLLDQIDVKAEQVMIATVFGQLTLSNGLEYGLDVLRSVDPATKTPKAGLWAGGNSNGSAPTNGTGAAATFADIVGMTAASKLPTGSGLNVYGMLNDQLGLYLHALQSTGNFTVLSRPSIYTNNNQRGVISSGQRIAVPTNSYNGGSTTGQSTNIEYRDVVLKLEVIPLVNSEKEITLQIALLNDDVVGTQVVTGVGSVPIIGTRELLTTVTIPNNATVVLGGLITTSDKDDVSGIPILSSIPGIGKLFSTTTKTKDRSELVIFIQPTIVNNDLTHDSVQRDADGRYKLAPDIHSFNNGPGVLPPPDSVVPVNEKASDYSAAGPVKTVKGTVVEEAPSASKTAAKRKGHPGH